MAELNQYNCIGRLTRDPELKYTGAGTPVCSFGLAVNRTYKDGATGEKKQDTCFLDVTAWGRMGEVVAQYLTKGSQTFITGRLQLDQWKTRDGDKRQKIKLVAENMQFLGEKGGNGGGERRGGPSPRTQQDDYERGDYQEGPDEAIGLDEEDVPF
jgi:single-strand DNA-binding protein